MARGYGGLAVLAIWFILLIKFYRFLRYQPTSSFETMYIFILLNIVCFF